MAITTPDINRPEKYLVEGLRHISATASGELYRLGLRNPVMLGPDPWTAGQSVVGPALTLQFMPKREDQYDVDEYADPETRFTAMFFTIPRLAMWWWWMHAAT